MFKICIVLTVFTLFSGVKTIMHNVELKKLEEDHTMKESKTASRKNEHITIDRQEFNDIADTEEEEYSEVMDESSEDIDAKENAPYSLQSNNEIPPGGGVKADGFNDPYEGEYEIGEDIHICVDKAMLRSSPSYDSSTVGYWINGDTTSIYARTIVDDTIWVNTHPTKNWWIPEEEFALVDQD